MTESTKLISFPGGGLSSLPDELIPSIRYEEGVFGELRRKRAEKKPLGTQQGIFYLGPIPEEWAVACQNAHPAGYLLACAIRARSMMQVRLKQGEAVRVSQGVSDRLGLVRSVRKRALAALEAAGLVRVERKPGCAPLVTVLPWTPTKKPR